jgi:hypothetical protein
MTINTRRTARQREDRSKLSNNQDYIKDVRSYSWSVSKAVKINRTE